MSEYGVTDKGFVLKRLDAIMDEVHSDLTEGFGVDTRLYKPTFLNTLVTSFCSQIATLWETAQDSYYAKYPATATGVNLDNALQYSNVRRKKKTHSVYALHCTGIDGTVVPKDTGVATDTNPEIKLTAAEEFTIERSSCNKAVVKVAAIEVASYTISIGEVIYTYSNTSAAASNVDILKGIAATMTDKEYTVSVDEENASLSIEDTKTERSNVIELSDNLTTESVTTIASFNTVDYGEVTIPDGVVCKFTDNVSGFESVSNALTPTYGSLEETDEELRHSYIAKLSHLSTAMLTSISAQILNEVTGVESVQGYENDTDTIDSDGLTPHSIEMVVEGGENYSIAKAILDTKACGIGTNGDVSVDVTSDNGDIIPIKFSRPTYLYLWLKIVLHGTKAKMPADYESIISDAVMDSCEELGVGDELYIQTLLDDIYDNVAGVTYIDIYTACTSSPNTEPGESDYVQKNVIATKKQMIIADETRIGVSVNADG